MIISINNPTPPPPLSDINTWSPFTVSGTYASKWLSGQENGIGAVLYQPAGVSSAGLTKTHYALDLVTGVWSAKADYPLAATAYLCTCTYIDTDSIQKIFVAGGFQTDEIDLVYSYNPVANTWATLSVLPAARRCASVIWDRGDFIYFVGGIDSTVTPIKTLFRYCISTDTWDTTLADLPGTLGYHGNAYYNGHIYTICGYDGTANVTTVYKYNVATNVWTTIIGNPKPARVVSGIQRGNKWWLLGGYTTAYSGAYMSFDCETETFTAYADLPFVRVGTTSALDLNNDIVIAGGGSPILAGANKGTVV